MRNYLVILFCFFAFTVNATKHYVATGGSDVAAGTIGAPWATFDKAFDEAVAGDTIYFRGGTYTPTVNAASGSVTAAAYAYQKDGTSVSMINIWAYPGETPILDCASLPANSYMNGIWLKECDYWYIKGLEIKNVDQSASGGQAAGIWLWSTNNCRIENVVTHDNEGPGISLYSSSAVLSMNNNLIKNCDSYDNYDPHSNPHGGNSDGFAFTSFDPERSLSTDSNTFAGCRSWHNSDDGFDSWGANGVILFDSCWAFGNGLHSGDGNGYKSGYTDAANDTKIHRYFYHCIAACNRDSNYSYGGRGFDQSGTQYLITMYNNFAYKNQHVGFMSDLLPNNVANIFRNNISYAHVYKNYQFTTNTVHDHNSWNAAIGITLSDADFVSLDTLQLYGDRQSGGWLPVITFGHLASNSDCIDRGVDVGFDYDGEAPDLGTFETTQASPPSAPQISTNAASLISASTVMTGGYMINDGGGTISSKGVCYGTSINPNMSDNIIYGGTGSADFTIEITGLLSGVTYHIRAFAINETGTTYGADESFTTSSVSSVHSAGKQLRDNGKVVIQ